MDAKDKERLERILGDEPIEAGLDESARAALRSRFEKKRAKVLLYMTAWLFAGIAALLYGIYWFQTAQDTRGMLIGMGILLVAYESTVLVKLWYWSMHVLISITKELKQLQLLWLEQHDDALDTPDTGGIAVGKHPLYVWTVRAFWPFVIAVGVLYGTVVAQHEGPPSRSYSALITLTPSGLAKVESRRLHVLSERLPLASDTDHGLPLADGQYTLRDGRDRTIPCTITRSEHQLEGYAPLYDARAEFTPPYFAGDTLDLRVECVMAGLVRREGDICTFTYTRTWGSRFRSDETVFLPEGAEILDSNGQQWTVNGVPAVHFEGIAEPQKQRLITITYRLANPENEQNS